MVGRNDYISHNRVNFSPDRSCLMFSVNKKKAILKLRTKKVLLRASLIPENQEWLKATCLKDGEAKETEYSGNKNSESEGTSENDHSEESRPKPIPKYNTDFLYLRHKK